MCSVAVDHRWPDNGRDRGCPFCAGHRVSSTNRFSDLYPEDIPRLDTERSGITADQLSVGSNDVVWWACDLNPGHPPFPRIVNNFTGGKRGNGTKLCPECRLIGTSVQELRLKAELALVLRIDQDRQHVPDADGRNAAVDIVATDASGAPYLVLEFDGKWWHQNKVDVDAAKAERLRAAGLTVVRIREADLERLNLTFDVVVGFLAAPEDAAAEVLDHLAALGLVTKVAAEHYREAAFGGPQNRALAQRWIHDRLGEAALRVEHSLHKERWARMYAALVEYETTQGHCYPPDQEVLVGGVDLARWTRKQRALAVSGDLSEDRTRRLSALGSWSTDSAHDAAFRRQWARYQAAVRREDGAMGAREATVWANNLRSARQRQIDRGKDLPAWRLDAVAAIPGWSWNPFDEGFLAKVLILQNFTHATQRHVSSIKQREKWNGHPVGTWLNSFRSRRADYDPERLALLEELPGWAWTPQDDAWNAQLAVLTTWAAMHGRMPKVNAADATEKRLGVWKRNNKSKRQGHTDDTATRLRALLAEYDEHMR